MTVKDWKYCQKNSDLILISGLQQLIKTKPQQLDFKCENCYGNYLISDKSENWNYIGEAKSLSNRLRQHSKERTSTFFKNYVKFDKLNGNLPNNLKISDFNIRTINTSIGRKELEEFGIVNIPANLNKFQLGKRNEFKLKADKELWNEIQKNHLDIIKQGEKELDKTATFGWFQAKTESKAGLYWVEHNTKGLIYIGESSNVNQRYLTHSGRTYFSAFRRNLGENILNFKLQTIKGKKRYFIENEDKSISAFLKNCRIKTFPVSFGRYELEEHLIRKYKPILNRKENK
jgi:predicted GIY-YIG superfamily endonuclease